MKKDPAQAAESFLVFVSGSFAFTLQTDFPHTWLESIFGKK